MAKPANKQKAKDKDNQPTADEVVALVSPIQKHNPNRRNERPTGTGTETHQEVDTEINANNLVNPLPPDGSTTEQTENNNDNVGQTINAEDEATQELLMSNFKDKQVVNVVDMLNSVEGIDISKYKQVTLPEVEQSDFDEKSDQTYIKAIITQIIHSSGSKLNTYAYKNYKVTGNAGRLRTGNDKASDAYDRIIVMGDCGTEGETFCIITNSAKQSQIILGDLSNSGSMGSFVAVPEAVFTGRTLGQNKDMPIVETQKPLVVWRGKIGIIPSVTVNTPSLPSTKWFALHGMNIHVANVCMNVAICGGNMCDRQEMPTDTKNCGCLHKSNKGYPLVISMRLFVKDKNDETLFKVKDFRSWKFTTLCVSNLCVSVKHTAFAAYEQELRQTVKNIADDVNKNGGWSMFGWLRVGTEADSSATDNGEQIGATTVSPHVVKLIPSTKPIKDLANMKFQIPIKKG